LTTIIDDACRSSTPYVAHKRRHSRNIHNDPIQADRTHRRQGFQRATSRLPDRGGRGEWGPPSDLVQDRQPVRGERRHGRRRQAMQVLRLPAGGSPRVR